MHKAFQKLQKSISSSNLNYQSVHATSGCVFGRSGSGRDSDSAPYDVPEGYLVVYVGEERRRFVIKAKYLSHPVFRALLNKSAEEFGYEHKGGLEMACEADFFEHLLWLIESNSPSLSSMEFEELVGFYASY
jgi:hypothetical protein